MVTIVSYYRPTTGQHYIENSVNSHSPKSQSNPEITAKENKYR